MLWIIPPIVIGGVIALAAKKKRPISDSGEFDLSDDVIDLPKTDGPDVDDVPSGRVDVRALARSVGAPDPWVDFFDFCFWGESRHRPDVGLGVQLGAPSWVDMNKSGAEAKASATTYDKNPWLSPCWPRENYVFGSGGLGAMFPASALAAFRHSPKYRCAHPWSIFDPKAQMIYAAWFARRLQGWKNWTGTALSLRIGWGNPSAMAKPPKPAKLAKWFRHCGERKIDPTFLYRQLPRWTPAPAATLWQELGVDDGWLSSAQEAA